ncbi:ATP F0F1 synthase subunit B [uncultured Enterovirga sp.]|uniref:F0F1 ATP synthase subunit B family protein n=1 Tax=uncultured Enterovirga sp. TaxID=2026352 RepID=UPI0035CBEB8D
MFFTAEFWVLVAFVILMGVIWYVGGFRQITDAIDGRGRLVQAELDEAKRLREEAAAVLADYTRRRDEAEREAEEMVAAARVEAEGVAREAHERMAEFVTRRTAAAEAKIAQAEVQATQQVRAAAAEAAVKVSEAVLREQVRGQGGEDLLVRSLGEIRSKLHS